MSKPTARPWRVNKEEKHPWIVECQTQIPGHWGKVAEVNFKPNARLIASAPDLKAENIRLREVKAKLLEACKGLLLHADKDEYMKPHLFKRIKQAEQAIAKAEGLNKAEGGSIGQ